MKSGTLILVTAVTLFAALAIPVRLAAQDSQDHKHKHHHYKLIDMGTFGGPNSSFPSLNRRGVVVGWSATSILKLPQSDPNICGGIDDVGSFITVAFQWQNGTLTDLGALPGGSNCSMPFSLNAKGRSVGESENGEFDPLTGFNQSRAVLWEDGEIKDLGSFGGNQNTAFYVNNRGQIVGGSQNAIPDPFSCWGPSSTQCRAFLWQDGEMQDLGTLGTGQRRGRRLYQ
jgi:hypothetical protein